MLQDKSTRRPIIDPLLLIAKSRRVMVALSALIVGILVSFIPELEAIQTELLVFVASLALTLIGGYSVEDAAAIARANDNPAQRQEVEALVKNVLITLVDEIVQERNANNGDEPPLKQ